MFRRSIFVYATTVVISALSISATMASDSSDSATCVKRVDAGRVSEAKSVPAAAIPKWDVGRSGKPFSLEREIERTKKKESQAAKAAIKLGRKENKLAAKAVKKTEVKAEVLPFTETVKVAEKVVIAVAPSPTAATTEITIDLVVLPLTMKRHPMVCPNGCDKCKRETRALNRLRGKQNKSNGAPLKD